MIQYNNQFLNITAYKAQSGISRKSVKYNIPPAITPIRLKSSGTAAFILPPLEGPTASTPCIRWLNASSVVELLSSH